MVESFLSKYGLKSLKTGSPVLSLLEAVAQSQLRVSDDIFSMLRGIALEVATGESLDRIGADELTTRLSAKPSSNYVTIGDSSFTKISTVIFQGSNPVIIGSDSLIVTDATNFPTTGTQYIYIGRGTSNYEGPLEIDSIDDPTVTGGNYWRINLVGSTTRYHATGESVILAQGGDRPITAGLGVKTPQGNLSTSVQFTVVYSMTLEDGEDTLENVLVRASQPGLTGNVIKGAISAFTGADPFTGATVTNPAPFTNGRNLERDEDYRERIRLKRRSRSLGTATALKAYTLGVEASDENASVVSSSFVTKEGEPAVLYVDDGTGYEEKHAGVAQEILVDSAFGGEQYFKTSQTPISKAVSVTSMTGPFSLRLGKLAFSVGGVVTEHTLNVSYFGSLSSASAYEVCASINADPGLLWSARTYASGTKVAVFAKADTNDDVQWVEASADDINDVLGFSPEKILSTSLYKNDLLLNKDGQYATIYSRPFGEWQVMSGNQTLIMTLDGIDIGFDPGASFPAFSDQDFIDAETGYTALGKNSLAAWAKVLNYRVPGITAAVVGNRLSLTSNRGRSALASIQTISGDLVTKGMFYEEASSSSVSVGKNSDYTVNRNTGEIRLASALEAGDNLSLGTPYTRAFLQSPAILATVFSADADLWFVVDGKADVVETGELVGQSVTLTLTATAWGAMASLSNALISANAQVGDWLIAWDANLASNNVEGAYRISRVNGSAIEFEVDLTATGGTFTLTSGGAAVVRTTQQVQKLSLAYQTGGSPNTYTATSVAASTDLEGLDAEVYRTNYVRFSTKSFGQDRDVALVAQNEQAEDLGLEAESYTDNLQGHMGSVESGNGQVGTPIFESLNVSTQGTTDIIVNNWVDAGVFDTGPPSQYSALGLFNKAYSLTRPRWSNNKGYVSTLETTVPGGTDELDLRGTAPQLWTATNLLTLVSPYTLAYDDQLNLVIDNDNTYGRFTIPFARKVTPTTSTYGATNTFVDADNGGASLAKAFGYGSDVFDWGDFAVWMAPRVLITQDSNILWRYYRLGPDGNGMKLRYTLPEDADADPSLENDPRTVGDKTDLSVVLGSGALRTGYNLPSGYPLGVVAPIQSGGGMTSVYYIAGLKIISYQRTANVATVRFQFPDAAITNSGLDGQPVELYRFVSSSGAPSGTWDFSAVTLSEWVPASGIFDKAVFSNVGVDVPLTTGNVGAMYFNATDTASFLGGTPAVIQGDYLRATDASGLPTTFTDFTASIVNVPATDLYHLKVLVPSLSVNTTIQYGNIADPAEFKIFANAGMTGTALVAAVNALEGFVSGTVISGGSNVITETTEEALAAITPIPTLADGVNYVASTTSPVLVTDNYTFTFKNAITAALATGTDWANEEIYLVPTSPANVVDWINTLGVTGLSQVAEVAASNSGRNVQIASQTLGSGGSVQIVGGKANLATAAVYGASEVIDDTQMVTVRTSDTTGMFAGSWVEITNSEGLDKSGSIFDASTQIDTITAAGEVQFGSSTETYIQLVSLTNLAVSIQKVDDFVLIQDSGLGANSLAFALGSVNENDVIQIKTVTTSQSGTAVNDLNKGLYRIVKVNNSDGTIWIKNTSAVDQPLCDIDIKILDETSIFPGDSFRIDTSMYGAGNVGTWTVADVGNDFTDDTVLTVDVSDRSMTDATSGVVLGSSYTYIRIIGAPYQGTKMVYSIEPHETDSTYSYVKLYGIAGASSIGAAGGSVLRVLDKLDFPTTFNSGLDGYAYSTGLIQEVNRVVYGDLSSPSTYPGVAAANSKINIEGPLVRKIQLGFQARVHKGFSKAIIAEKIRNAAAGFVNGYGVGEAISISAMVEKLQQINGLRSLVVLSPSYDSAHDLIPIQPFERARVLNPDTDVTIVFVGE